MAKRARRLSLGALGLSLALLVAATWGTGFFYLLARLGAGSPVRLALVDGIHVYVGLASAAYFLTKVRRVGFRRRVPGVNRLLLWQRWISWSLLLLYAGIYVTGVLALLPLPARWLSTAVNAHLLSSVWAVVPTTWHIWHYRHRAIPYLARWKPAQPARRYWAALAVVCLPLLLLVSLPRALSALPLSGNGRPLVSAGLGGIYLDRLLPTGDGRLLAGGDGLYMNSGDGAWRRVELPSGGDPETDRRIELGIKPAATVTQPAAAPAGHAAHLAPVTAGTVLSLARVSSRDAYYVGTTDGLYYSPWPEGPYVALPFPARQVRDLAIDPGNPYEVWAAAEGGTYLSVDGGHSWAVLNAGLARPASAWTLAFSSGALYASDTAGVYRWDPVRTAWSPSSIQPWVTTLRAGDGHLYAASQVSGARSYDGKLWTALDFGSDGHAHGSLPAGHLLAVVPAFGHAYPLGGEGSLAGARDAAPLASNLWVVGDLGAGRMAVDTEPAAGLGWWIGLLVMSLLATFIGVRMIHPGAKPVTDADPVSTPTFQEVRNVSFQATGRDRRGRLRSLRLRRSKRQHG